VNRLADRKIYAIEVVTNAERLIVEGEGGVLTFMAKDHSTKSKALATPCSSFAIGLSIGTRRGAFCLAEEDGRRSAQARCCMCWRFSARRGGAADDRRATTHWRFGSEMATRYPGVRVQHDPLWVKDGNIYTSAGISAGIDLALAWVEEDCGAGLAHEAARELVLFLRRPGGQPQVSVSLASQASEMMSIRELQIWILSISTRNCR